MNLNEYAATEPPAPGRRRAVTPTPPWSPGLEHDGEEGALTTGAVDGLDPDWDSIFRHWNLDPDAWEIVPGTLRVNAWEGPTADGSRIFRQYKASIRRRRSAIVPVDDHLRAVTKWRPRKPAPPTGDASLVVAFADWQVGGHGGTDAFLARFSSTLDRLTAIATDARKECSNLVALFLGDMVEGTSGNYAAQSFEVDLGRREQIRIVRQCEAAALRALSPLFSSTTAVAVGGNHGRGGPKVTTHPEDNDDLLAFESVAELLTESGAAERHGIRFVVPETRSVAIVDASGTQILAAHGDQVNGNADRIRDWWRRTAFARWGDADAGDFLLTGHRHHLRVEELAEDRWFFVCPTLGGESRWYGDQGGGTSRPGTLTFRTANRKWWRLDNVQPDSSDT